MQGLAAAADFKAKSGQLLIVPGEDGAASQALFGLGAGRDPQAFRALAAEKVVSAAERAKEAAKHNDDAARRYAELIDKYPEHSHVKLARQGLGMAYYRKGDLEKAQKALEAVPAADRVGALAEVSYCLADVYLLPQLYAARRFEVDLSPFPRILRVERLALEHPAFRQAHPDVQADKPA